MRAVAVTTDFSDSSRHSFGIARELARGFHVPLYLVHVVTDPPFFTEWQLPPGDSPEHRSEEEAARELGRITEDDQTFHGLDVRGEVVSGDPVGALVEFQVRTGADLVVLSSHGHAASDLAGLGRFADRVVHELCAPVLVFRDVHEHGLDRTPVRFERILIPCNFTLASWQGVEAARLLSRTLHSSATVVFVDEDATGHGGMPAPRASDDASSHRADDAVRSRLDQIAREGWDDLEVESLVTHGPPAAGILWAARERLADLIVLGCALGPSESHDDLGGIAEEVVAKAPCSVLIARQAGTQAFARAHSGPHWAPSTRTSSPPVAVRGWEVGRQPEQQQR